MTLFGKREIRNAVCSVLAGMMLMVGSVGRAHADTSVLVDASTSVQSVLGLELIPMFIKQTGIVVNVSYGATGKLAKQMADGAPIEVFLGGDDTTVKSLASQGLLDPATIRPYAVGQLAVMLRPGFEGRQASVNALSQTWVTKVAIPDPTVSAYGKAALDILNHADVYDTIVNQNRLVAIGSSADAFQDAETGNVDATITALGLIIKVPKANFSIVPSRYYKPLNQTLALSPTASEGAKSFAAFLLSPDAQAIFKRYGFLPPKNK